MNTLTYFLAILLISNIAYSQIDTTIWNDLQKVQSEYYELSVPSVWPKLDHLVGFGREQIFEASGKGLPFSYNNAMITCKVTLSKIDAKNINEVKQKTIKGYTKYSDRVFEENYSHDEEKLTLTSGEKAYFLHTRFYRESETEHQSKYDMVVYSSKAKTGYRYSIIIRYSDSTYEFEEKYHLKEFAKKLFSYFKLT